jgi:hypothetical protein
MIGLVLGCIIANISFNLLQLLVINILTISISFATIELIIHIENQKRKEILKLLSVDYSKSLRSLNFTMSNPNLLEGEKLFRAIYLTLMNNKVFTEFGFQKIIILSCSLDDNRSYNLHSNILISNDTTFEDYYLYIKKYLVNYNNIEYGYNFENITRYSVKVWNADDKRNLHIKQTLNAVTYSRKAVEASIKSRYYKIHNKNWVGSRSFSTSSILMTLKHWSIGKIIPLSLLNKKGILKQQFTNPFFTMDIETINFNNKFTQLPIAISSCGYVNGILESKIFLIDYYILKKNPELAVSKLWNNYFSYLENYLKNSKSNNNLTIFAHNLGEFDGYFLYKGLLNHYQPEHLSSIIDDSNSFISIKLNHEFTIEWKDSLRIFPTSLDKLCKMFGVDGKLLSYNPKFQSIEMFNNPRLLNSFKKYSIQDAVILFKALNTAQLIYFDKFKVDIESVYSTATLSLKIFRTNFQSKTIYILPSNIDLFIRSAYFGGGTDVYVAYAKDVYYYDVNSLYPHAMLKPMPDDILNNGKMITLANRTLESFFGFAYVKVVCPLNMLRPVLPFHHEGKTIYPVGSWYGVYFSEELKAVAKLGYEITLIKGYEFTKADLFGGYVNTFYDIKKHSTGVERDMAKLQLNNLYGYFGRKQVNILTENINNDNLDLYLLTKIVKSVTPINDTHSTILSYSNINFNMLEMLNNELHSEIKGYQTLIKSNVAIAAAVTAYARIEMIPYKIDPNTLYTDTDSIFTTKPIDPNLIGLELGQMKDELKGLVINEAYFLGPKKYGYYLIDGKEFSVFSGVPRNTLTFEEVKAIFNGQIINKNISNRFFKSFNSLNIDIKNTKITIKNTNHKLLVDNFYLPIRIHSGYNNLFKVYYNKFKKIVVKNLKKLFK